MPLKVSLTSIMDVFLLSKASQILANSMDARSRIQVTTFA